MRQWVNVTYRVFEKEWVNLMESVSTPVECSLLLIDRGNYCIYSKEIALIVFCQWVNSHKPDSQLVNQSFIQSFGQSVGQSRHYIYIYNYLYHALSIVFCGVENSFVCIVSKMPLEETVTELRKELEQCLINNKAKRDQVFNLETELNTVKSQLKEQESKAQRMEVIAQEHEVGCSNTSVHRCV